MLAGDINQRPFIIGIAPGAGICWDAADMYLPVEIRFGRVLSKHFYMTGNLETGFPWGGFHINPSITLGYHFGDKIKTKGKKK